MKPPRCGVSSSCSPLWRRYRHDCPLGDVGPWRRFYDDPERAWAGFDPSDRLNRGGTGSRSAGGVGWGLRPVGPVAGSQEPGGRGNGVRRTPGTWGIGGAGEAGGTPSVGGGPVRACDGSRPDGRVYPPGHTPGQPPAVCRAQSGVALAKYPAAGGPEPGFVGCGDASHALDRDRPGPGRRGSQDKQPAPTDGHQGADRRAAGTAALPLYPIPGRPAEHRGGEP